VAPLSQSGRFLDLSKPTLKTEVDRPRIYLSVSSEGFGHSSRALALAAHFPVGDVLIGTYGSALQRIQATPYPWVEVPPEIRFMGKEGCFDVGKTVFENQTMAINFNQLIQAEEEILKREKISVVVADGRMASVVAASRLELPCLVLTNQSAFYPFFAQDSSLMKLLGLSFEWVMKLWLSSAEEILIPDFPPPHTVCLPNLSQNDKVKKRTRFVGPLVAWKADEITPQIYGEDTRPSIVVSLGGHAYRAPLLQAVLQAAVAFPDYRFDVLSCIEPNMSAPENVFLHGQVKQSAPYLKAACLVITQAGHSTAMELLTLGKPAIIVPDRKQIEQENNAARMAELGVAKTLTYDELNSQRLASLMHEVLGDVSLRRRAEQFAEEAALLDGSRQAAKVIQHYASRLIAY
jgi:UDP-N-acetylglucosamine--N-acetylmuramyl-(pentapeptide) pyrophosphoryl-undecaprenol N-acetylglucosamine transferase